MHIATVTPNKTYAVVHETGMQVLSIKGKRMRRAVVAWLAENDLAGLGWRECAAILRAEFKP